MNPKIHFHGKAMHLVIPDGVLREALKQLGREILEDGPTKGCHGLTHAELITRRALAFGVAFGHSLQAYSLPEGFMTSAYNSGLADHRSAILTEVLKAQSFTLEAASEEGDYAFN